MSKAGILKQTQVANWLFHLDRILRGEATKPSDIRQKADIQIPIFGVAVIVFGLAVIYGFCMGVFALVRGFENAAYQQAILQTFASMCKVPLLFFLTLVVTFPSLYVFNALVGSKLKIVPVLKLLVASLGVNLAVLASAGPILAFFSVSTPNYQFIVLLNVVVFAIAGMLGLVFLIQTLNRLSLAEKGRLPRQLPQRHQAQTQRPGSGLSPIEGSEEVVAIIAESSGAERQPASQPSQVARRPMRPGERPGPLDQLSGVVFGDHVRKVFFCWIAVFGLVGAQMGWVLRPFIGAPETPFSWFRARHSNFFESVSNMIFNMLFG